MEVSGVIAKYKDYSDGQDVIVIDSFRSWDEDGNYTVFYSDISTDSAELFIPTRNVISITLLREESGGIVH